MESTKRLRALLLVLMACWLTLQSAAAWTMPLRIHHVHPVGVAQAPADTHAHHAHEADAAPMTAGVYEGDCDHCEVCHLASSGFLLRPWIYGAERHRWAGVPGTGDAAQPHHRPTPAPTPTHRLTPGSALLPRRPVRKA